MKVRWVVSMCALICLAALLTGCGGGGGGDGGETGVMLTIGTDTAFTATLSETLAPVLVAPLEEGATVVAYDFKTGNEVARGTLDANGMCRLEVTPGLTVVVVITGTRDGKDYRLSTIIPVVPTADTEYVADPATSMAAEAIAQVHFKTGTALDQATVDLVLAAAKEYAGANPTADYSLGGLIKNTPFGDPGSLDPALDPVKDVVPAEIDNDLVAAKNAVQQIKEAGVPIVAMLNQEHPDVEGIFTETVQDAYSALADRLDLLIAPALFGKMEYNGDTHVDVFDLDPDYVYTAELQTGPGYSWVKLVSRTAGPPGIKINLVTDAGTYALTAVQNGSSATVTQKFSGDSLQQYVVTLPIVPEEAGANPSFAGSISLKDKDFTTPLTFTGTGSATGPDKHHYSKMVFQGTLNVPNLSSTGQFEANFPSAVPAGADPDDKIYDFPTSFSMTNSEITVTDGSTTISLSGSISVTTSVLTFTGGTPEVVPKHVEMSGAYANSHSGLTFDGNITGDFAEESYGYGGTLTLSGDLSRTGHPSYYANLTFTEADTTISSTVELRVGATTLEGNGTANIVRTPGKTLPEVTSGTLTLTNQAGVQFNISSDASGTISGSVKVGTRTVASISKGVAGIRVTYDTDPVTFDEIIF